MVLEVLFIRLFLGGKTMSHSESLEERVDLTPFMACFKEYKQPIRGIELQPKTCFALRVKGVDSYGLVNEYGELYCASKAWVETITKSPLDLLQNCDFRLISPQELA